MHVDEAVLAALHVGDSNETLEKRVLIFSNRPSERPWQKSARRSLMVMVVGAGGMVGFEGRTAKMKRKSSSTEEDRCEKENL